MLGYTGSIRRGHSAYGHVAYYLTLCCLGYISFHLLQRARSSDSTSEDRFMGFSEFQSSDFSRLASAASGLSKPESSSADFAKPESSSADFSKPKDTPPALTSCEQYDGAEDTLVILKTGWTEATRKLPWSIDTWLPCIPHSIIVSDHNTVIQNYTVQDIIALVPEEYRNARPEEFILYNAAKHVPDDDPYLMSLGMSPAHGLDVDWGHRSSYGWALDRWKFAPMYNAASLAKPNAKWYVFVEADTAIDWKNLFYFLSLLDPAKPEFRGSAIGVPDAWNHGGSGLFLSYAALEIALQNLIDRPSFYDVPKTDMNGDILFADILRANLTATNAFPMCNGEKLLADIKYENYWCYPAVFFHHMDGDGIHALWNFSSRWSRGEIPASIDPESKKPRIMLHKDLYQIFLPEFIDNHKSIDGWNNTSSDIEISSSIKVDIGAIENLGESKIDEKALKTVNNGHQSYEDCEEACMAIPKCKQFSYRKDTCRLGMVFGAGHLSTEEIDQELRSMWIHDRIIPPEAVASIGECEKRTDRELFSKQFPI